MATAELRGIPLGELAAGLRSVDPRVVLVPPRVLRRVRKGVLGVGRFGHQVPQRAGFATTGLAALAHAERDELGLDADEPVPEQVILLAEPDLDRIKDLPRDALLVRYWRELFHARVHLSFLERPDRFPRDDGGWVAERIERIGRAEFAEARAVLVEDHELNPPVGDRAAYVEFAATYLELLRFHPELLPHVFPAIRDREAILSLLAADVDPDALLEATRLPGAPARPGDATRPDEDAIRDAEAVAESRRESRGPTRRGEATGSRLKAKADAAARRDNHVRAAILRARAATLVPEPEAGRLRAAARADLDRLARRLRSAVGLETGDAGQFRRLLPAFLERASRGLWPRDARLLYDLQKVCSDYERRVYSVDLVGWARSFGRRPLKRLLPDQNEVLVLDHLRAAGRRVRTMRGPEPARSDLEALIARAVRHKAHAIKDRFRARIHAVLHDVGLRPTNLPERVGLRKLVEELLDLIAERGFLRFGDLRDALSRNPCKLPDLSGFREFVHGDPLLRADVALSRALEGVHHKGEVYLRGLQRASSLAFGTKLGRVFSKYVALPFGGTFIVLEGLQHLVGPLAGAVWGIHPEIMNPVSFALLGVVLLGVVNVPEFRRRFFRAMGTAWRGLRFAFFDAPAWLLNRPIIREVLSSRTFRLVWNWLAKPALVLGFVSLLVASTDWSPEALRWARIGGFVAAAWLVNSRPGRVFEEIAADGATRLGHRLWREAIPGLVRSIMVWFHLAMEGVERLIYSVDEWLRFRGGESRLTFGAKAIIGVAWAVVAYVARIYINLLIEPQLNPIKHFPVVTVSHKIILPMSPTLFAIVRTPFLAIGPQLADTIAVSTVFLLPGVFGFLAWELKANWRLYAANRAGRIRPDAIGHHGETLSRLLRRGFHSGTIPKLYRRLRRADRKGELGRGLGPSEKALAALHHNAEAIRHFVERNLVFLLEESRSMAGARPTVGAIECATGRVIVEVRDRSAHSTPARLSFEEARRRLHVSLIEPGWLAGLREEPRRAVGTALAGLFASSDVDCVGVPEGPACLDFRDVGVSWASWVEAWDDDMAGRGHPATIAGASGLCPPCVVVSEAGPSPTVRPSRPGISSRRP